MITREQRRKIQKMNSEQLFTRIANICQEAFEAGYAEGLTADLDEDAVVMDTDEAIRRLSKEAIERLIGE